jgi:serine/threonine protein kinase
MGEARQTPHSALETFAPRIVGRYVLYAPIARGGMATIHLARQFGAEGFNRIVAVKRLFPRYAEDPEFVKMFLQEAEIASRIRHPNVVPVVDVVAAADEVLLVQEYVHGVPLDRLFRSACSTAKPIPARVVVSIVAGVLAGLHAAHELRSDSGDPLHIVHRDVSPQNIVIGVNGAPRLLDFGVAQGAMSAQAPNGSRLAGKLAYMAPEQLRGDMVSRTSDVYSCGVLLWELATLRRLHAGSTDRDALSVVKKGVIPKITDALEDRRALIAPYEWRHLTRLQEIVERALAPQSQDRYATAAAFLQALLRVCPEASPMEIASWVKTHGGEFLLHREQVLAENEASWRSLSQLAVSMAGASGPASGGPSSPRPEVTVVSTLSGALVSSAGARPSSNPGSASWDRWRRMAPWAVAALALLVTSGLTGLLVSKQTASPSVAFVRQGVESAVASPLPSETPWTTKLAPPVAIAPRPADSIVERAVESLPVYVPPAARRPAASPSARGTLGDGASDVPAGPTEPPGTTTSEKPECDPPFFFQGKKKIFKPSCL